MYIIVLLRETIVIRTRDIHKSLYVTLFSLVVIGPDYYAPPYYDLPGTSFSRNPTNYKILDILVCADCGICSVDPKFCRVGQSSLTPYRYSAGHFGNSVEI